MNTEVTRIEMIWNETQQFAQVMLAPELHNKSWAEIPDHIKAHFIMLVSADIPRAAFGVAGKHQLTFEEFTNANVSRCLRWHNKGLNSWSASDWMVALTGELGELASLLKMRNRERDGMPGNKFSPSDKQVADEVADVFTYLDLLAVALSIDLPKAIVSKFNEVSERVGFPERL